MSRPQNERGFALWEMVVLLAVVALFLAGVIVLASEGIESLQPKNADRQLSAKGEALMDRLEALTREAIVIYFFPAPDSSFTLFQQNDGILFAADLDGDAAGGIEDVSVTQPGSTDLVARIGGGDARGKEVILTKILDARHQPAFQVQYEAGKKRNLNKADLALASPDLRVTGLHIFLKLADRGKTLELDRAFKLKNPAPVRTAPQKDKNTGLP